MKKFIVTLLIGAFIISISGSLPLGGMLFVFGFLIWLVSAIVLLVKFKRSKKVSNKNKKHVKYVK